MNWNNATLGDAMRVENYPDAQAHAALMGYDPNGIPAKTWDEATRIARDSGMIYMTPRHGFAVFLLRASGGVVALGTVAFVAARVLGG